MFDEIKFQKMIDIAVEKALQKFLQKTTIEQKPEKKYIYSIKGLADFLQCSIVTAQKIKNSGKIPFQQIGRKVIFEESEILEGMKKSMKFKF